jgi:pyrimidine operon attenuation protein/uracil phosphoribosyltransferase
MLLPLNSFWKPGCVNNLETWQTPAALDRYFEQMTQALLHHCQQRCISDPLMIGIHTGGVWVAEQLHQRLQLAEPLGALDISFYRDDFTRIGLHPQVNPCSLPVAIDDRHVILVDDVLQSGRTVRAALNVLFDYGRPATVLLAILAERNGRELPIHADVVGFRPPLHPGEQIKLCGPHPLHFERVIG